MTTKPTTRDAIAELYAMGLQAQLRLPVLEAAKSAQEPGQPLSRYVLAQCRLRSVDPKPYLEQIGVYVIVDYPVVCDKHQPAGALLPHPLLTDCEEALPMPDDADV